MGLVMIASKISSASVGEADYEVYWTILMNLAILSPNDPGLLDAEKKTINTLVWYSVVQWCTTQ